MQSGYNSWEKNKEKQIIEYVLKKYKFYWIMNLLHVKRKIIQNHKEENYNKEATQKNFHA